jgi:hypothetical protein
MEIRTAIGFDRFFNGLIDHKIIGTYLDTDKNLLMVFTDKKVESIGFNNRTAFGLDDELIRCKALIEKYKIKLRKSAILISNLKDSLRATNGFESRELSDMFSVPVEIDDQSISENIYRIRNVCLRRENELLKKENHELQLAKHGF